METADPTNPSVDPSTYELKSKKPKKDFQDEVREIVPKANELAERGALKEAIELLLGLEKRARLGGDAASCGDACLLVLKLCRRANDWNELCNNVTLLFKRRSQFKSVQGKIVQEAAEFVPDCPDRKTELELIATLRHVAEGKLFLEVERARLTRRLSQIKESDGDINGAADVLQEEQVETYGAMDKREKYDYLLEQIRLVLAKRDFVRASILSRKVQKKVLDEPALEDLKIRFHRLLLELHEHEKDALEMAKSHLAIASCLGVKSVPDKWIPEICMAALTLALAPKDSHQDSEVRRVLQDKEFSKVPFFYKKLLERLVTEEIAPWPLPEAQQMPADQIPRLLKDEYWRSALHDRIIEHNVGTVAQYYTRIRLQRLASFLGLTENETEVHISRMVTSTSQQPLLAKMDRPAGIVVFGRRKDANMRLTELKGDISKLLDLVEKTVHLIHKENMIHGIGGSQPQTGAAE
jgi:26S proteasome regulatory subunit N5